jgi:hypothetical protein
MRVPSSVVALVYGYLEFEEQAPLLATCVHLRDVSNTKTSHLRVIRLRQGDVGGMYSTVCLRLFGMTGTRELYMCNTRVGDRNAWIKFTAMDGLIALQICGVYIRSPLPSSLRRLELWLYKNGTDPRMSVHFNASSAAALSSLEHLQELRVSPAALMADAIPCLPRTLTTLQICSATPNPTHHVGLWHDLTRRLPHLTSLTTNTPLDCADPLPLLDLPKLATFDFSGFTGISSPQVVRQWSHLLTNLCSLTFSCNTPAYRVGFDFAARLPCLHTLRVTAYPGRLLQFLRGFQPLSLTEANASQNEGRARQTEISIGMPPSTGFATPSTRFATLTLLSITDSPNVTSLEWIYLVASTLSVLDMSRTRLCDLTELPTLTRLHTLILDDLYKQQTGEPISYPMCIGTLPSARIVSAQKSPSYIHECVTRVCNNATIQV